TIAVGRFARTLGALTKGGVIILEALSVVRDTLGNELLGREIDVVAEKVKRGESLAEPLSESGYFPPLLVQFKHTRSPLHPCLTALIAAGAMIELRIGFNLHRAVQVLD
ncbi:unnamed protein product, partial [marine sediment metagenome]